MKLVENFEKRLCTDLKNSFFHYYNMILMLNIKGNSTISVKTLRYLLKSKNQLRQKILRVHDIICCMYKYMYIHTYICIIRSHGIDEMNSILEKNRGTDK